MGLVSIFGPIRIPVVAWPFLLLLSSCSLIGNSNDPISILPKPDPNSATLRRDALGFVHVDAANYYGAGYAVGVAQVDDFGLDLQLSWALLSPDVESTLTQEALGTSSVPGIALPGQVPLTLEFDERSFPLPVVRRQIRPPTLEELRLSLEYVNFYEGATEAADRLEPTLIEYLKGYVAGANMRFQQRRAGYQASTDPRIRYMVSRGLHQRRVSLLDPLRSAASGPVSGSVGLVQIWADSIERVPSTASSLEDLPAVGGASQDHLRFSDHGTQQKIGNTSLTSAQKIQLRRLLASQKIPRPHYTASNEFVFSGRSTESGRPIVMVDPHLPSYDAWLQSVMTAVIRTPDIIIDGALNPPGNPVPMVGHAMHPRTRSGMALNGTANAYTPTTCWYSLGVNQTLERYYTSATGTVGATFTTRQIGRLTVREAGIHGRLIGQKKVLLEPPGAEPVQVQVGFLYRHAKDSKYSVIETTWPAFHSKSIAEFHAALNRHALPTWNMSVGFSTPDNPSTSLYINNQVASRKNPNPDGNESTLDDWNYFMDAMNPLAEWLGGYHTADELPQVVAEPNSRKFLHCHNCSADTVTGVIPAYPYMIGGYAGGSNPRQAAGELFYSEATANTAKVTLKAAVNLANDKRDLQVLEVIRKLQATVAAPPPGLTSEQLSAAAAEMAIWRAGAVDFSISNTRVGRVAVWLSRMNALFGFWKDDKEISRLVLGTIYPPSEATFNPDSAIENPALGLLALAQLALLHSEYPQQFGPQTRTWGEIQRWRPTIFRRPFAAGALDLPIAGGGNSLLSLSGPEVTLPSGLKAFSVTGGQNYVQIIEVGVRSLLKKSVAGTTNPALPYSRKVSELFAQEAFTPTGAGSGEQPADRFISSERLRLPTSR
jgi:hypothetical protein